MTRSGLGRLTMALSIVLLASCGPDSEEFSARLETLASPNLEGLDDPSRERLQTTRTRLSEKLGSGDLRPEAMAAGFYHLGRIYLAYDFPNAAAEAMDVALELGADKAELHYLRAVAAVDLGDLESAARHFAACLDRQPDNVAAIIRLADVQTLLGQNDAAESALAGVLVLEPGNANAVAQLGRLALKRGRAAEAVERLEQALTIQPEASALYHNLASALRQLGRNQESQDALSRAGNRQPIIRDPAMSKLQTLVVGAGPHLDLARRARNAGQLDVAISHLDTALSFEPENTTALHNLGVIRGMQGDPAEAVRLLGQAANLAPDNADIRFDLATALAALGDLGGAIRHLERVIELRPNDQEAQRRLDLIHQAIQDTNAQ